MANIDLLLEPYYNSNTGSDIFMNFVKNARIAFFFASINLTDKLELANSLKKSLSMLDGDPLLMPIPDDAPSDIPRIILRSKTQEYALNVAPQRIDFFYNNKQKNSRLYGDFTREILKTVKTIEDIVMQKFSASINRLGLIIDMSLKKDDPIKYMLNCFNKSFKYKDALLEAQIHMYNKETVDGFNLNNWIRIIAQKHDKNKTNVIVSNDINTIIEDKKSYTNEEINKFYSSMLKYVTENIKHYV